MGRPQVFLVPGFFGFTSLGAVSYFHRVRETLARALAAHRVDAEIIECRTRPTGSLRRRAARLFDDVTAAGGNGPIHFVGHSTGGLDVRLLVSPEISVTRSGAEEQVGARTRSVISISTPHHGTPLANFFTTVQGRRLLQTLAVLATTGAGRNALAASGHLVSLLSRIDSRFGRMPLRQSQLG